MTMASMKQQGFSAPARPAACFTDKAKRRPSLHGSGAADLARPPPALTCDLWWDGSRHAMKYGSYPRVMTLPGRLAGLDPASLGAGAASPIAGRSRALHARIPYHRRMKTTWHPTRAPDLRAEPQPMTLSQRPGEAAIDDLGGTMVDTVGHFEVARALADLGWPPVSRAFIERKVGEGSEHRLTRTFEAVGAPAMLYDEAWARCQHHCVGINDQNPDAYPCVHEGLQTLRALGTAPVQTLMVVDSSIDAAAARAAGCRVVRVGYGQNHGEPIANVSCQGHRRSHRPSARLARLGASARLRRARPMRPGP